MLQINIETCCFLYILIHLWLCWEMNSGCHMMLLLYRKCQTNSFSELTSIYLEFLYWWEWKLIKCVKKMLPLILLSFIDLEPWHFNENLCEYLHYLNNGHLEYFHLAVCLWWLRFVMWNLWFCHRNNSYNVHWIFNT